MTKDATNGLITALTNENEELKKELTKTQLALKLLCADFTLYVNERENNPAAYCGNFDAEKCLKSSSERCKFGTKICKGFCPSCAVNIEKTEEN